MKKRHRHFGSTLLKIPKNVILIFVLTAICMISVAKAQLRNKKFADAQIFSLGLQASHSDLSTKRVTLRYDKVSIEKLLKYLEQTEHIQFSYHKGLLANNPKVTLRLENVTLDKALKEIFKYTDINFYPLKGGYIVLRKRKHKVVQETVRGTVTDAGNGETLPGVNILVKGTTRGTSTNAKGHYSLTVPSLQDTLIFSYIGFKKEIVPIAGRKNIDVVLKSTTKGLNNIVVTALGFKEQRDEQGVSTVNVKGEDIAQSGEKNVISGLSGKVAGVQITSTSGDPGAGARIQIRGARTLGSNQPLFILDGMPISNASQGSGTGGVVQQSRLNDLNPDNIESVEILKGPSAAALWGSRAANGVVVITTKKGSRNADRINVSVASTLTLDQVNRTVPLQTKFGEGRHGEYEWAYSRSWGDKISDRQGGEDAPLTGSGYGYATDQNGNKYYAIADGSSSSPHGGKRSLQTYDHTDEIFGTGVGLDNSVTLSGGDKKSRFYLNVSNLNQNGIVKHNSNYKRTSFRVNADRQYSDWFHAGVNASYVHTNSDRVQQGSNTTGIMLGMLRTPPDFNNDPYLINYTDEDGNTYQGLQRSYRSPIGSDQYTSSLVGPSDGYVTDPGFDNPFWSSRYNKNNSLVNRVIGNTNLQITPNSWLSITHRIGVDYYEDQRYEYNSQDNASEPAGTLRESVRSHTEINSDLIIKASQQLGKNLSGSATLGWNLNQRSGTSQFDDAIGMVFRNVPRDIENFKEITSSQNDFTERTAAYYAKLKFDAFDQVYVEGTGRYESASTFGPGAKSSFFYPSANIAWQFTDFEPIKNKIPYLSFGKLRFSYGESGIQPGPYQNFTTFFPADFSDGGFGSAINSRQYGNGFSRSQQLGNPNLVPETVQEYEFGGDLRFLDDRIQLGLTRYYSHSEGVILDVDIAPSSGFAQQVVNSVRMKNDGYEVELDFDWIKGGNFSWNTHANWSKNNSLVTDLAGVRSIELQGISVDSRAAEGYPFGVLWGGHWMRNDDGSLFVNDGSMSNEPVGFPVEAPTNGPIGDPNPDWSAGISNTFSYKNFSLRALVDIRQGGDVWNGTRGVLYSYGTHKDVGVETFVPADQADNILNYEGDPVSDFGEAATQDGVNGFLFRGRLKDWDGSGPAPTVALDEEFYHYGPGNHFNGPAEQFVEDGGYVRLREVSFSYRLNSKGFQNATSLSSIDFRITGQNLFLWTDYSGIDPETNLTGTGNGRGMDYFNNPNTRSFIFSVKLNY